MQPSQRRSDLLSKDEVISFSRRSVEFECRVNIEKDEARLCVRRINFVGNVSHIWAIQQAQEVKILSCGVQLCYFANNQGR